MSPEDVAAQLVNSSYLKFILSFHIIASSAGIVALLHLYWRRKTRKQLAHKSLILLIDAHTFWTFILCVSTLMNCATTLYAHLSMRHPRDILVPASTCLLYRSPSFVSIYGSIFSQMAMAAERYRASKNLANYEYSNVSTGYLLNTIHIVAVLFIWYIQVVIYRSDWTATHCTLVNPSREIINTIIAMCLNMLFLRFSQGCVFLCEVATILTFKLLLSRNIRLRDNTQAALSLTERYQLTENIRMIKLMTPIIWTHTSLGMLGAVFYLILKFIFPSSGMYPLIEESINMLPLQGICIPIIFMHRLRAERLHDQHLHEVNTTTGEVLASHHMKAIVEGW